ncbi:TOMM precursor leader peptide-binding protein [Paenibacillus koleovorans]|uniref:TOMM precursor leader peptide-binding protein n=1 Tax=Paenibacillus koleovorans TaxID=121608 RepID=UPI000FD84113|nr:TOMM precursor leader peptide-binding protein [Paenibacillus koleovorans]
MSKSVAIIGDGLLAEAVRDLLSDDYKLLRLSDPANLTEESSVELALVLSDSWEPAVQEAAEERCQSLGLRWLRGFVNLGEGVVGPFVNPGTPGCSRCADTRRHMAGNDRRSMWELQHQVRQTGGRPDPWASRSAIASLARHVVEDVRRVLEGRRPLTEGRIRHVRLQTLESSLHVVLPDPQCPHCSRLPDDSADDARITLQPSPKIREDRYRCRPIEELKQVLAKTYLDYRTGLLNMKMADLTSPFADASVNLPLFGADEGCAGRTHNYADSELTAILEGLERYCGLSPRGKRTKVFDSYSNLKEQALNPVLVGFHEQAQYDRADFPFVPFDPDRPIDWVWGYSFLQERPILVPESIAYYSSGCGRGFVYETSNGCALGGTREEAIFYGIMETVERDSFLLPWFAQLQLPRLDPATADDVELSLMLERLRTVAGYDVHLFNSTMEHGIPSVWMIAKNRSDRGMNIICAAGAHPDPVKAVKGAIHEIAGMVVPFSDKFESNRERYAELLNDPFLVREMEDHSMLYSLPEAEERFGFLMDGARPLRSFRDEFAPRARHADLTDDLNEALQSFRRLDMDVIVVEQSTPEIRKQGLHCVKVLIPGMLPMTFGHHLVRLQGLDRVLTVPAQLGYVQEPLTREQLNPNPHPFP